MEELVFQIKDNPLLVGCCDKQAGYIFDVQ
jgi:hypothetical protein